MLRVVGLVGMYYMVDCVVDYVWMAVSYLTCGKLSGMFCVITYVVRYIW